MPPLQFVEKFSEAKEAAKRAIEERKHGGKPADIAMPAAHKPSPHQPTPATTGGEEGKREEGAGQVAVNGEGSAGRKVANASSAEV